MFVFVTFAELTNTLIMKKLLLLSLLFFTNLLIGADIIVDPSGSGDYTTIQVAVNNAQAGDVIIVNNGTYAEAVDLSTAAGDLIIKSATPFGATVNGGASPAFSVVSGKTASFEIIGFNLNAASGIATGVLYFNDLDGKLIIADNTFVSGFGGDAIRLENTVSEMNAFIHNNFASAPADNDDFVKVINNSGKVNLVVDNNTASDFQDDAVEVTLAASNVTSVVRVTNNTFSNWVASGQGIDIFCGFASAPNNLKVHFIVHNNTLTNTDGDSILINADGVNTRIYGSITNNDITGNANTENGINVDGDSTSNGVHLFLNIDGNLIEDVNRSGINFRPFADDAIRDIWTLLVNNNNIDNPNADASADANIEAGIRLDQSSGVDDENYDINIEVTNNVVDIFNGNTRCISIEQPTTGTVSTAIVNFTEANNNCPATTEGTITTVPDAVTTSTTPTNIGNKIWYDANANGIQDGGEIGVSGANIRVANGSGFDFTTTTDVNGLYMLPALLEGNYTMTLTPPADYPNFTVSNQGSDSLDSDFNPTTGTYNLTVIGGAHDISIDGGVIDFPLAVAANELENSINIYPNPTNGIININILNSVTELTVEVYNILGQKLIVNTINEVTPLNIQALKTGIYVLKFKTKDRIIKTYRVLKK